MIHANIATTRNQFSRLLARVKRGETIIITERGRPIAQLQPLDGAPKTRSTALLSRLYESGALTPPAVEAWDVPAFVASLPTAQPLPPEASLVAAVLAERNDSR